MDKFTENLTEGLKRFALAGVGAVALTIDKSKEIIDQLAARGEATAADGQAACDELQKKMGEQLSAFTQKLKADYENASFEQLLARCDRLTPEQKQLLIDKLTAAPEAPAEEESTADSAAENCACEECSCEENPHSPESEPEPCAEPCSDAAPAQPETDAADTDSKP